MKNFKEMMERYEKGTASEEERAVIEAELSKREVIDEYLEKEIEGELLASDKSEPAEKNATKDNQFIREIKRTVRRAFLKAGIATAAVVLAVVLFLQFGLSPLQDALYYNPNKVVFTLGEVHYTPDPVDITQFELDTMIYNELINPLLDIRKTYAEPLGSGEYLVEIGTSDYQDRRWYDRTLFRGKISRNRVDAYQDHLWDRRQEEMYQGRGVAGSYMGESEWKEYEDYIKSESERLFPEIDSAMKLNGKIEFMQPLTVFEAYSLSAAMNVYSSFCIETGTKTKFYYKSYDYSSIEWDNSQYPDLFASWNSLEVIDINTPHSEEADIIAHVKSMMQYMLDQKEFRAMFAPDVTDEELLQAMQYIDENGIKIESAYVDLSFYDLLGAVRSGQVKRVYVYFD